MAKRRSIQRTNNQLRLRFVSSQTEIKIVCEDTNKGVEKNTHHWYKGITSLENDKGWKEFFLGRNDKPGVTPLKTRPSKTRSSKYFRNGFICPLIGLLLFVLLPMDGFTQVKSDVEINFNRSHPKDSLSEHKLNDVFDRVDQNKLNGMNNEEALRRKASSHFLENDSIKNLGIYKKADSIKNGKVYSAADSLFIRTRKFYHTLQGVELTDEEIEKRTEKFLSNNDSLIHLVSSTLASSDQAEALDKKRKKYEQMNASLTTIRSYNQEQALDTLTKIKDSRKFRETLRREGIDMGIVDNRTRFIGKAKRKFDELTFADNTRNMATNNLSNWPLSPDYYKSRLMGYYNYYSDSVQKAIDSVQFQLQPPRLDASVMERGSIGKIDSLRAVAEDKGWLKLNKKEMEEGLDEVKLSPRKFFLKKPDYAELIIGLSENDPNHLTLTPSVAYEIAKDVDLGLGVEAILNIRTFENTILGYKGLLRYKPEKSIVYFQAESVSYIPQISFTSESQRQTSQGYEHSLNAGFGLLYGLGAGISINTMLLYRVEKARYSLSDSPIVFRLGINFN